MPTKIDPRPRQHTVAQSFTFAIAGLSHTLRTERNFRIHLAIGILVFLASLLLRVSPAEAATLILATGLVLSLELINTSIERTVDLVTEEQLPLARTAKDVAAAAVLLASLTATIIGATILIPHLVAILRT